MSDRTRVLKTAHVVCHLRTGVSGLALVSLLFGSAVSIQAQTNAAPSADVYFTPNQGQWDDSILYRGEAPGGTLWFTGSRVYYHLTREIASNKEPSATGLPGDLAAGHVRHSQSKVEHLLLSSQCTGSQADATVTGEGVPVGRSNYFLGNDPARWRSNLPDYPALMYQNVYPGIDLRFHELRGSLEYDFLVAAGADPSLIRMEIAGAAAVESNPLGQLVLETSWGQVTHESPSVYQVEGCDTSWIPASFVTRPDGSFGFALHESPIPGLALVIDPVIQFCTYLGGSADDAGSDPNGTRPSITVDDDGEIVITGYTKSGDFPVLNALDGTLDGTKDIFVTQLDPTGGARIFSTFIGGTGDEYSFAVGVDNLDNIYVTGTTFSGDFPTVNAVQPAPANQGDAFLVKLSATGSSLGYATYYGGFIGTDWASSLWVDPAGDRVLVGGDVFTGPPSDFPTTVGAAQTAWAGGTGDCFVIAFDPTQSGASSLVFATLLGGIGEDGGALVAQSPGGDLCVAGFTNSGNFPGTAGGLQGNYDLYYARLAVDGSSVLYARYLGGTAFEQVLDLAFDNSSHVLLTGYTFSNGLATVGAADETRSGADGFVMKLPVAGGSLTYGTYLGGLGSDEGRFIEVDAAGRAIVTGFSDGLLFPEVTPVQAGKAGLADAFLTVLNPNGSGYDFSSYVGGTANDWARGLARNPAGDMLMVGYTESTDLDVTGGAYDGSYNGAGDAFVIQVSNIDSDYDLVLNEVDNCPQDANFSQNDADLDGLGNVCDLCPLDPDNDADGDGDCGNVDNCPFVDNPGQEDDDLNGIGDVCEVGEDGTFDTYKDDPATLLTEHVGGSPGRSRMADSFIVHMVLVDPQGDSIGPGFNTIGLGSTYDTTQDLNSPSLTGPDGQPDDRIHIPEMMSGPYTVRLIPEVGASDSAKFTLAIRINGNQQLFPDDYRDASVNALGTTIPATYVWVASTILTGDVNADGDYTSADIILLVNYTFKNGPPPDPESVGDVNCTGTVTSADIITMVNHVFKGGLPPCSGSAG